MKNIFVRDRGCTNQNYFGNYRTSFVISTGFLQNIRCIPISNRGLDKPKKFGWIDDEHSITILLLRIPKLLSRITIRPGCHNMNHAVVS